MHVLPTKDQWSRPLRVLRLSLTARCNLACTYCRPDNQEPGGLLTLDQRVAVVRSCVGLGVSTLRLTGGEPLLNHQLEELIQLVQPLREHGLNDVALTSNGVLLTSDRAKALKRAGLDRLTVSLDAANAASVARMAGLPNPTAGARNLEAVLNAIEYAREAGFDPSLGQLKLNAVIQRGVNDDQLVPLAELARERRVELRLIEFMDVGNRNGWQLDAVVTAEEMLKVIGTRWNLQPIKRTVSSTARRWRYSDDGGSIAIVASVSQPFCRDCNRLRVTADGKAYTCLFAAANAGLNIRPFLQPGISTIHLDQALIQLWEARHDRYSEERLGQPLPTNGSALAEMAYLGG